MIGNKFFGLNKKVNIVDDATLLMHLDFSNTTCFTNGNNYVTCLKSGEIGYFNTDYAFPTYVNEYGGALDFSGASPKSIGFDESFGKFSTGEVTFEAIVYYNNLNQLQLIISKRRNTSPYIQYNFGFGPTSINGVDWKHPYGVTIDDEGYLNGGPDSYVNGGLLTVSGLYHMMVVMKSEQAGKVFLNGVDITSNVVIGRIANFLFPINRICRLSVGAMTNENVNDIGYGIANSIQGKIYQVRMYERALTDEEVLQNYNANKTKFGL